MRTIVANDLSKDAYHSMCRNIEHNQVGEKVKPSWREARLDQLLVMFITVILHECSQCMRGCGIEWLNGFLCIGIRECFVLAFMLSPYPRYKQYEHCVCV